MKSSSVIALLILAALTAPSQAQQPFVLTDGTPLRVRLNRNVSSADAQVGETVDFDVVEDVLVNGVVVIQRNSRVLATVTEARPKGLMGKAGKLNMNIDHARSVLGEKIALRAVKEYKSGDAGNAGAMDIAASIVTAPFFLFMKGKDVTIPKGTEVTAYVHGDARLDEARLRAHASSAPKKEEAATSTPPAPSAAPAAQSSPAALTPSTAAATSAAPAPQSDAAPAPRASKPASASGITNADVLALKEAGFSDDLIISKIKSSRCAFKMETSDMIELKKAGLSDRVIGIMMEKTQ
ncbi:MAG: hypothetical protein LLG20_00855 [Acidobacteriales bacterium]|nr:hypothetical protein [Terriglobales bacterium]